MLVTAGLVLELRPSASAEGLEVWERVLSSALQPAVPQLVLQGVESEQRFEAEWPGQAATVFGRQAVEVVGPALRREAARRNP